MQRIKIVQLVEVISATSKSLLKFGKYYLATVLLAVAFFTHFFLPHPEYYKSKAGEVVDLHENKINEADQEVLSLAVSLSNNQIDRIDFDERIKELVALKEIENELLAKSEAKYQSIKAHNKKKYFGFPSLHKFVWSFGLGIIISVLSLKIMFLSHSIEDENRRNANAVLGLLGGLVGGYFFSWIFYPANDLPYVAYMAILVGIGAISSVLGYYLSKSGYKSAIALKGKIRFLMNLMVVKTTEMRMVKDIDVYSTEIINPAINKLDE